MNNFFKELKRRNVFKVATAYAIAGWLIIQIITAIEEPLSLPNWLDTVVIIMVGIGFPISVIIAWAFELTPDGLKKTDDVERDTTQKEFNTEKGKRLNKIIISVLSLLLIFVIVERVFFAGSYGTNNLDSSVAVLPFVNMSDDKANEYFSDGLSEELLNGLAKIEGLQVAGRTSSFSFKGKNQDIRKIGNDLNVNYVLEGSVRKDGNSIRITAQLIKVDDGYHMWSETYDRELKSVFAVQEDISRKVVNELKVRLLPEDDVELSKFPTDNIEAYNYYLKATQLVAGRNTKDIKIAIENYKNAIALDKDFGLAYSRLAIAYGLQQEYGAMPIELVSKLMKENVDKAFEYKNNLGVAYRALGYYKKIDISPGSDLEAKKAFEKGLEYEPSNAYLYNHLGAIYATSNGEEAFKYYKKAYEIEPLSPVIKSNLISFYFDMKKYDIVNQYTEDILLRFPQFAPTHRDKANFLRMSPKGDLEASFQFIYKSYKQYPDSRIIIGELTNVLIDLDLLPVAEKYLNINLQENRDNFNTLGQFFNMNVLKGEIDANLKLLDGFILRFGDMVNLPINDARSYMFFHKREYQKSKEVLQKYFSKYVDPNYKVTRESFSTKDNSFVKPVHNYALHTVIARIENNEAVYKPNTTSLKSIFTSLEEWSVSDSDFSTKVEQNLLIAALEGDAKTYANQLRKTYFDLKWKYNWRNRLIFPYHSIHKDAPEVKVVMKEIFEDAHKARAKVIAFLKEQGEWNSDWDQQLFK